MDDFVYLEPFLNNSGSISIEVGERDGQAIIIETIAIPASSARRLINDISLILSELPNEDC